MRISDLGIVGNGQFSAIISPSGEVIWCCLPRFDSDPVFSSLLDERDGGRFSVGAPDGSPGTQRYAPNTNVLETMFDVEGGRFRVTDFAPRFELHGRVFHPTMLVRRIEPMEGAPRVRVRCDPRLGWSRQIPGQVLGSNHVQFEGFASPLRLTTDIPLAHLDGQPFVLNHRRHLVLAWGEPVEEALEPLCDNLAAQTLRYWQRWVKHCSVPPLFQDEVIRSALALKLCCYEDTGAIVAAMTTSLPESPGSGRTWDYRYCWLRDAYYALGAFRLLGHFEEREKFIGFLLNVAGGQPDLDLAPLYRIDGKSDLEEQLLAGWPGWGGEGPVRVGNAAALHRQHDVFGEMVLALAPIFLDERFSADRSPATLDILQRLARKAISVAGSPDAGIWEHRGGWRPRTFSSLMCWAAADRMAIVADRHVPNRAHEFRAAASRIRDEVALQAWAPALGGFAGEYGGAGVDASLLQMATLRFLPAGDARLHSTVDAIQRQLSRDGWLLRYQQDDGFGVPSVAFVICTFWLVEALAAIGRPREAREVMERARAVIPRLGLISEDFDAATGLFWGNFPQAYSHVGLIHAAFAASPSWSEVL